jgi:hypothetical protein
VFFSVALSSCEDIGPSIQKQPDDSASIRELREINSQHAGTFSYEASTKLRRLLDTDMVPSSLNPLCSKQQRAMRSKKLINDQHKGDNSFVQISLLINSHVCFSVAVSSREGIRSSIQKQPDGSLSIQEPEEIHSSFNYRPLGDIEDQYASDPEEPRQPLDIFNQPPAEDLFHDENSRDSTASLSSESSSSKSSGSKKYMKDVVVPMMKFLLEERKARDYLASANERKDSEIADHKHKRKSQEGKTAAQTRKANLALQGEASALKESAASKAEAERQTELREKTEANNSTLMIANVGFSAAFVNLSTGNQVCFGLFSSVNMIFLFYFSNRFKIGN